MSKGWRTTLLATIASLGLIGPPCARADFHINGSFGPNGDVGFATSPSNLSITFGDGQGSIYQMDGFVNVPGRDLGAGVGMSADLANGAPTGLGYAFNASQPTTHQLLLTYSFTNNSGAALNNFQFLYFADADIGPNFNDESATVNGSTSLPGPTSYQVGDPTASSIFTNLMAGTLNNANDFKPPNKGDVSAAIAFNTGTLGIGQSISYQVLLSDDQTHLGSFFLTQTDPVFTRDTLTISGQVVPEPSSLALTAAGTLLGLGFAGSRRRSRAQACTRSQ